MVHENHGLGIYQGIEKVEVDTVTRDYMKISYADGMNSIYTGNTDGSDPEIRRSRCKATKIE